jgi:hypothetical protein
MGDYCGSASAIQRGEHGIGHSGREVYFMEKSSQRKGFRGPSPAMVVACIALAVALSGVSYAAVKLAKNSVGTAHLMNGAVTGKKLAANAVTGAKVADNSLRGADINEASLQGVNAARVGGIDPEDILVKTPDHTDAYVASGGTWVDRDGAGRDHVSAALGTSTQICTLTGASTAGNASAYQDVHLPQGALITEIVAEYVDDAASNTANGTVSLVRQPLFSAQGASQLEIFTAALANTGVTPNASAGLPGVGADQSPAGNNFANATIDNDRYAYQLRANPGTLAGVAFCSVRVSYEQP